MGNLTTFTILNDGIDAVLRNSDDFCKNLYEHALSGETCVFSHEEQGGLVRVQRSRHANDHTVYVHMGGTLCEMHPCSKDTERLVHEHPDFFKQMLEFMEKQVKDLRAKYGTSQD